jgi:hypothetical protein
MQLSDGQVDEFRQLYVKEYGKTISVDDARAMISRLSALYEVLLRPLPVADDGMPNAAD